MAYLNRDQRREMILQAAMQIALTEGFTAMTVRRIATEAQTSTGQVHHHFSSASHLKAEAFLKLMEQLDEIEQTLQTNTKIRTSLYGLLKFGLCNVKLLGSAPTNDNRL
ncbi:transcriptional regulator [Acinetobacter baumannii]|nr:transcriptional regulator [Acinetobacter baumannii]